ncbi:MAG: cytochrome c biogenesis CcdA family protein [Aquihabitans sp.]
MIDAQFAYAFTTGMVATVNPCGFAMLPAYLGYFLGTEAGDDESSTSSSLLRGLVVAGAVSAGFLLLFAVAGMLVSWTSLGVGQISPWFTVVIGVALTVAGIAFLRGWEPTLMLPRLDKGGRNRGLWSMFLFGLSYAVASLSCTLPVFTTVVVTTFSRESYGSGVATFVAYGAGMAMLLTALTLTLALAKRGLATGLRRALPYVHRVSGAIMVLMGIYLAWWGVYELRLIHQGEVTGSGPVDWMTDWSSRLSERISELDPLTVALAIGLAIAVVVLVALIQADRSARDRDQG